MWFLLVFEVRNIDLIWREKSPNSPFFKAGYWGIFAFRNSQAYRRVLRAWRASSRAYYIRKLGMAEVGQNGGWAGQFQLRLSEYHIAE